MADYFASMGNAVVDRSPDELIGAIVIALALALAMAGLYSMGRRKVTENLMPMVVLMIVANLVSMTVGAGYLAHARKKHLGVTLPLSLNSPAVSERMLIDAIFRDADEDQDGLLSGEEAAVAADKFVRRNDAEGDGKIDARSLASALLTVEFHGRGRSSRSGRGIERASAKSPTRRTAPSDTKHRCLKTPTRSVLRRPLIGRITSRLLTTHKLTTIRPAQGRYIQHTERYRHG